MAPERRSARYPRASCKLSVQTTPTPGSGPSEHTLRWSEARPNATPRSETYSPTATRCAPSPTASGSVSLGCATSAGMPTRTTTNSADRSRPRLSARWLESLLANWPESHQVCKQAVPSGGCVGDLGSDSEEPLREPFCVGAYYPMSSAAKGSRGTYHAVD